MLGISLDLIASFWSLKLNCLLSLKEM